MPTFARLAVAETGSRLMQNSIDALFGALLVFSIAACGQSGIRNSIVTSEKNLPRPGRILVYGFAVSEREVTEYQGIMRQQPSVKDPVERQLANEVKDAVGEEVVDGLRALGVTVESVSRGTAATGNELLVDGRFLIVDEGNPLRRLVIGLARGRRRLIHAYRSTRAATRGRCSNSPRIPIAA